MGFISIRPYRTTITAYGIAIAIFALLPFILSPTHVFLMEKAFTMAIFALGFNLILGYLGMISFGHALYFAVGAYTAAWLIAKLSINSFAIVLIVSIATSALAAAAVGFLSLRHTKVYFSLLTMAFAQMFYSVMVKFYWVTGGTDGIGGIVVPNIFGMNLSYGNNYYYFILLVFTLCLVVLWVIANSPFGKTLQAIRENATRVEFLGVPVWRHRWLAFILSGIFSGIGGALFAPLNGHVSPEQAYWTFSGEIVFISILGGPGVFEGPALGAFIFTFLKYFAIAQTIYWLIILGSALVLMVLVLPKGVMGTLTDLISRRLRR